MFPSFDAITALSIAGIVSILVLYILIVYKKGWLKKDSKKSEAYYLCPNPKCRRVFKKPVWLTDLSQTPPEPYQACPQCGISLHIAPSFGANKAPELHALARPPPSPSLKETQKPSEGPQPHHIKREAEVVPQKMEIKSEFQKPSFQPNTPKVPEKPTSWQPPKSSVQNPEIRRENPQKPFQFAKKHDEKKPSEAAKSCSHFFGYVKTLPKNTPIPDECLWCPSIVKCLTNPEKVEA